MNYVTTFAIKNVKKKNNDNIVIFEKYQEVAFDLFLRVVNCLLNLNLSTMENDCISIERSRVMSCKYVILFFDRFFFLFEWFFKGCFWYGDRIFLL